jgi:hypothetical protein
VIQKVDKDDWREREREIKGAYLHHDGGHSPNKPTSTTSGTTKVKARNERIGSIEN